MKRRIKLLVVLMAATLPVASQKYVDIGRLYMNSSSPNQFENGTTGSRLNEVGIDLLVPFVINSRSSVVSGLMYEGIQTKLFDGGEVKNFSSIMLKLGVNRVHSGKWSGTYLLLPKVASDFQQVGKRDFQLGAIALLKYKKSENLIYKAGLYANSELFGAWAVPIFGLYYLSPSEKLEANLTLPLTADMNYKLTPGVIIGTNFFAQVRSYHLLDKESGTQTYVTRATNEIYGYLGFNLSSNLILQTRFGHSLGRSYRVYDDKDRISFGLPLAYFGDERKQLNTDFGNGWVYQMQMIYRVRLK